MISAAEALEVYKATIETEYAGLLKCIEDAITDAAKKGRTNASIFVDFFDLTKNDGVLDLHSYIEQLGYEVAIEDYVCHADPSKDLRGIVKYNSDSLEKTLMEQKRCKGGLVTIYFG